VAWGGIPVLAEGKMPSGQPARRQRYKKAGAAKELALQKNAR
jgi:hypothetical protein